MGLFGKTKKDKNSFNSVLPNSQGSFNPKNMGAQNQPSQPFNYQPLPQNSEPFPTNEYASYQNQNVPTQNNNQNNSQNFVNPIPSYNPNSSIPAPQPIPNFQPATDPNLPIQQFDQYPVQNPYQQVNNLPQNIPPFQRAVNNSVNQSQPINPQYNNQQYIPMPQQQGGSNVNISEEKMVQNIPVNNQMPQKKYTGQKHMVPVNKLQTGDEVKVQEEKFNPMKEILKAMVPFGLANKKDDKAGAESDEISLADEGGISVQDFIAPSAIEVDFNEMRVGNKFARTIFAIDYKFSTPGMLEQIVNYEEALDVSMFYYPINSGEIVKKLRQKISEFEASLNLDLERGRVPDAYIKVSLQDAIKQQELLASGIEKWFNFALYITIKADTIKELNNVTQALLSILASKEISAKTASLAMEKAFQSSLPAGVDKLFKVRNMDTTSIANTFPFTSSDLSMDKGIMYGINTYNRSLVIFDRFSMPNANMVVFATSGAGKSFMVKLEAIRSLMLGTEVIVIDPENEYQNLAKSIGGSYISFSQDGANKVNPFELSGIVDTNEDELKLKELSLIGFFKLAFGELSNTELAILERAIRQAYFEKGITNNPATHRLEAPRMEDLYKVFKAAIEPEAQGLADRLERFIIGSASGIFDKKTNVDLNNPFTVFSIRDLSDELKPLAMYFMMDMIWNRVKREPKKRILVVDEAWLLMRYPESALFINSIAKRARKYYLGLTVISQNVEDFLQSDIGVAVVTNSSIQVLLKQHPTAIDKLQKVFYLSDGEKNLLLGAGVGMGLFFADNNHVAIEIKASDQEYKLCSTRPQDVHAKKSDIDERPREETIMDNPKARAIPNSLL